MLRLCGNSREGCNPSPTPKQPIPRLQHQPLCAVLAELADLVILEYAEGFAGVIGAHHISGIEDVAQLVESEAVGVGVVGIEFGPQQGAAFGIEEEGWAVVADVLGPGLQRKTGVRKLKYSWYYKIEIYRGRIRNGDLLDNSLGNAWLAKTITQQIVKR